MKKWKVGKPSSRQDFIHVPYSASSGSLLGIWKESASSVGAWLHREGTKKLQMTKTVERLQPTNPTKLDLRFSQQWL
jgi:hypothetical protein